MSDHTDPLAQREPSPVALTNEKASAEHAIPQEDAGGLYCTVCGADVVAKQNWLLVFSVECDSGDYYSGEQVNEHALSDPEYHCGCGRIVDLDQALAEERVMPL